MSTTANHSGDLQPPCENGSLFAGFKRETILSVRDFVAGGDIPEVPTEIFLEMSNVCNLKCVMCPTFSALAPHRLSSIRSTERGFLDTAGMTAPLADVLKRTMLVHCHGYGEPTIHPDFKQFISYVSSFDVMIDFFTNGMNLTEEVAEFLVDRGIYRITVSFSGTSKEEYENVYLGGIYEQVLAGLARLDRAKTRRRSRYPIVEINSLAFEHHVARLDSFVALMGAHGVNVIYLKALQEHASIPELTNHASVLRSWVEGPLLNRAKELAESLGIILSCEQYERTLAVSEAEWQTRKREQVVGRRELQPDTLEPLVSITRFAERARQAKPIRPNLSLERGEEKPAPARTRHHLEALMALAPAPLTEPFYCMEPFSTMYVRRNGLVKPCCFAGDHAYPLGDIHQESAAAIWRGDAYNIFRNAILNGKYPMKHCQSCLQHRIGPVSHSFIHQINQYLGWYENRFGHKLLEPSEEHELKSPGNNTDIANRQRARRSPAISAPHGISSEPLPLSAAQQRLCERIEIVSSDAEVHSLIRGHLDHVIEGEVLGWAQSPYLPGERLVVEVLNGASVIGCAVASLPRQDLVAAGIGDGMHGFAFRIPNWETIKSDCAIAARLAGTHFYLSAKPIVFPGTSS